MTTVSHYDVIIVGAGLVGSAFACALAEASTLKIALVDANNIACNWSAERYDFRVSAISPQSQQILQQLQVWEPIKTKRFSPFSKMRVWDAESSGIITFDSREIGESALGYIIENNVLRSSLLEQLNTYQQLEQLSSVQLTDMIVTDESAQLITVDQRVLQAKLIVAADGTHSWIRARANIDISKQNNIATAIVATVQTELPHQATAYQRFLPTGPLAFLPLADPHQCSIVWSLPEAAAQELLALNDSDFAQRLSHALEQQLGNILATDQRHHFVLQRHLAKHYIKPRIALIGDAAHTIHPLAGQGVNLGLLDAICLSDIIKNALTKKRDFSHFTNLRRYERARKANNSAMFSGLEYINNLFLSDKKSLQTLRAIGLNTTNRLPWLKNFFSRYAMGIST